MTQRRNNPDALTNYFDRCPSRRSSALDLHTPGPWRFQSSGDDRIVAERFCVALVTAGVDDGPDLYGPTFEANACLIAAAPELLAACRAFVDWYNVDSTEQKRDDAFYAAQAAIAKATQS